MNGAENRRRYLRIDDEVSLYVHPLTAKEVDSAIVHFENRRLDFSLMSHMIYGREQHMPQMRIIEKKFPMIAGYLKFLESQIETLSSRIVNLNHCLDPEDKQDVNISATGLSFDMKEGHTIGSMFEVAIMLFPARTTMLMFGKVIRSDKITSEDGHEIWKTALEFTHLHEEDREVLIKHIHQLQVAELRKREESVYAE